MYHRCLCLLTRLPTPTHNITHPHLSTHLTHSHTHLPNCIHPTTHLAPVPGIDFKPQFSSTDDLRSPEAMFGSHHAEFERITARVTVELQGVDLNTSGGPGLGEEEEGAGGEGASRLAVSSLAPADVELLCDVHASAFAPGSAVGAVRDTAVKDVVARSELCAR